MQKNKHKRIRINKKQPTKKTRIYTNSDITFSTNIPETVERQTVRVPRTRLSYMLICNKETTSIQIDAVQHMEKAVVIHAVAKKKVQVLT